VSSATTLPAGEVHVWWADPGDLHCSVRLAAARALLAADEVTRLEHYRWERDRQIYLATRVLVRTVLSKYESVAPADWVFSADAHGRPTIVGLGAWLNFNLSNTHGLVVCAVAREIAVGVDVENTERAAPVELAERFFARVEVEALNALHSAERASRFFDYWTLKESYIKARGIGLALPLDRFAFSFEPGNSPRIAIDPVLGDDASAWDFVQLRPTATHLVSVCARRVNGRHAAVVLNWQRLLGD
jgi:4'-phosphopantetheinyl transferase